MTDPHESDPQLADEVDGSENSWHNRLSDLQILAESGDLSALATAVRWIAEDSAARDVWRRVEHDCARLRTSTEAASPEAASSEPASHRS